MIRFVDGTLDPFLWLLADWSVRWGVLILALAAWLRVRPPRRAATRHLLCAAALAAGLVLPMAPRWSVPWRGHAPTPAPAASPAFARGPILPDTGLLAPRANAPTEILASRPTAPVVARAEVRSPKVPARAERPSIPKPEAAEGLGPWRWARVALGGAWLAGMLVSLVRLLVGGRILARLRSSSKPVAGVALARYRSELGVRRGVAMATHEAVGSPVLLGGLAPTILVPDDWDAWPEATRRACLLHELAHLERRDDLAKLAAELARAPFWFHPALAWLVARLDREAELACDDMAVGRGVAPAELARLLLDFAARPLRLDLRRLGIGGQTLSFFDRNTVLTRITRLLEDDMSRAIIPPSKFRSIALVVAVAALATAIGGAQGRALEPDAPTQPAAKPKDAGPGQGTPLKSFSVVVKDAEGRPVEGATVVAGLIPSNLGQEDVATDVTTSSTGVDGSARFDREPKPEIWVVAFKEGHSFVSRNLPVPTGAVPISLTLPRAGVLSGTITDAEGRPIEGAEVRVNRAYSRTSDRTPTVFVAPALRPLAKGTPMERALVARSDASGKFRFESLPDKAEIALVTSVEGKALTVTVLEKGSSPASGKAEDPVRIVLNDEARVSGRVVSAVSGVGVSGRSVTLRGIAEGASASLRGKATTDAEGRFEIRGLGPGRANILLDDVPADGPWTFLAATDVRLTPGSTSAARIKLVEGVSVTGSVTSTDGKPIPGASVTVYGARNPMNGGSMPLSAVSDASGVYRFRMPPGNAYVMLNGRVPGYTSLGNTESNRSVLIPDGQPTFTLPVFAMAPGVNLAGRIVDATGKPLEGAKLVGVCNQTYCSPLNQPSATADAQGRFHLDMQADGQAIPLNQPVTFQVRLAGGQEFDASLVPTGKGEVTIKLPTLRDGGPKGPEKVAPDEIAGVVIDVEGKPLEGVLVHPYSWVPFIKTTSDKEGKFRVKVPEQGKIEVRLSKDGFEPREFLGHPTGQPGWVVVMGSRTYFEGRVLGPDGGPVADAPIRADAGGRRMGGGGLMTECWTEGLSGKDGRYRLYVEPGMYEFQIRVPGVGVIRSPKHAIATDEAQTLDLTLGSGVDFEARVVDAQDGKPVAGLVLKDWRNPTVSGTSDSEGILRIPSMLPGTFKFGSIEAEGYARWWSDACLNEWSRYHKADRFGFQRNLDGLDFEMKPGMARVTIQVEKAATIRGRVIDPDGKPVAGATVAPALTGSGNSLTGDTRFSVETGADGAFTMKLPASGEIAYNLVAHDGKYQQWRTWANGVVDPFRTTPGQVIEGMTLRLTKPATVRGRVVDAEGKPVAGREVRASAVDRRENRYYDPTTKTGPDGTFELHFVRAGEQFVQAAPFWLDASQAPSGSSRTLTLAEGETKAGLELTAQPDR